MSENLRKPMIFDVDDGYHKFTHDELASMETLKKRMEGLLLDTS